MKSTGPRPGYQACQVSIDEKKMDYCEEDEVLEVFGRSVLGGI